MRELEGSSSTTAHDEAASTIRPDRAYADSRATPGAHRTERPVVRVRPASSPTDPLDDRSGHGSRPSSVRGRQPDEAHPKRPSMRLHLREASAPLADRVLAAGVRLPQPYCRPSAQRSITGSGSDSRARPDLRIERRRSVAPAAPRDTTLILIAQEPRHAIGRRNASSRAPVRQSLPVPWLQLPIRYSCAYHGTRDLI